MLKPVSITNIITTILFNIIGHIIIFFILILSYPLLLFRLLVI